MELTKEYFDQTLENKLGAQTKMIIQRIDDSQEELARMVKNGFDDVMERLDVHERVEKLEVDMARAKEILHLN